jgi:hypothetical protein
MPYPAKLGKPCWDESQVETVLTIAAQTGEQSADAFLAAHSPFRFITNVRDPGGRELAEEEVFQQIFSRRGELQVAIKGEPGTGKSHLVHWLKLRADFEAEHGDEHCRRLVRILVQRGNGSLKDALRQVVERLGKGFQGHLQRLQGAIDKMSTETARATLLAELGLEIHPRWGNERTNRPPFPKKLRLLAPALRSEGIQRWLLRQGGVIDQIVRRLTEGAPPAEQESWPGFTVDELSPPPAYLSLAENGEDVREFFMTDLRMEPKLREHAVEMLNIARADAVASLTGLSGPGLREIFDNIRRDLLKQGRDLALFIEDVSVTGLDREIINALEPQKRGDLCRMVAVIGITSNAWEPLPENQKGRFDPAFEVGAGMTARWSSDPEEVARFTARYLNAIRSTDKEIAALAAARREHGGGTDVPASKCDGCLQRKACHGAFGHVVLPGGIEIGLFPFTPRAPQALLAGLREDTERTGVRRSQRGLIENVLIPVLQSSRKALENEEFPRPASLPVQMKRPGYWTGFTHTYLGGGGWNAENTDRIQLLAEYWVEGADADGVAEGARLLLGPLGLPKFSQSPPKAADEATKKRPETKNTEDKPLETRLAVPPELQRKLQALENWSRGETLKADGEFRDLVKSLFTNSIRWPNQRDLPIAEAKRLVDTSKFPRIEGQDGNPIGQPVTHELPRTPGTRTLLEALVQFSIAGKSNWDFEHGELHKRNLWRWLSLNRSKVIDTLKPAAPVSAAEAIKTSVRALAITAILRDRKPLPKDPEERVACLFDSIWADEKRPAALATPMREVVEDLEQRQAGLREFLIAELGAGQGWTGMPKDYLDPRPILDALREDEDIAKLDALEPAYHQNFWQKRFAAVRGLAEFENLSERLQAERVKAGEIVAELRVIVEECGAKLDGDLRTGFEAWLGEFAELVEMQRGSGKVRRYKLDVHHPAFENLWEERLFQTQPQREKLAAALASTAALLSDKKGDLLWLTYDPQPLRKLQSAIGVARTHLQKLDKLVSDMEEHLTAIGGGDRDALIAELGTLAAPAGPQFASTNSTEENESE